MGTWVQLETTIIKSNLGKYLFAVCAENNAVYHTHVLLLNEYRHSHVTVSALHKRRMTVKWIGLIIYILYVILWLYLSWLKFRILWCSWKFIPCRWNLTMSEFMLRFQRTITGILLLAMDQPYHASLARLFRLYLYNYQYLIHYKR